MTLKAIELVFENCEVLHLDKKDIILLSTSGEDTRNTISNGKLTTNKYIKNLFLAVHKDAVPRHTSVLFDEQTAKMRTDVTSIRFFMEDWNDHRQYFLDWEEDGNPMYCKHQRISTTANGHQTFIHSAGTDMDHMIEHVDLISKY